MSFVAGNNITISTNTSTKTITINASIAGDSDPGPAFDRANAAFAQANAAYTKANTGTTALDVNADIVAFTIAFS